jgi:3-hydroxyacyl-CoA dehydrogenase
MIEQYSRQAGFLLEEGCTPEQVDKAVEKFGFAMGPFRMGDLAGNDIGWAIRKRRYVEKPGMRYSKTADLLCEMGRYGQKTGAGWYDYAAGKRDAIPSPVVVKMIEDHRAALGVTARKISDDDLAIERLVGAGFEAEQILNTKLKGLGDLESAVGKKEFAELMGDLLTRPPGKPTLVAATDKRPAISDHSAALKELLS